MSIPQYLMGQVGQIDFSPVENALTRMLKQQQMNREVQLQQQRMGMDQERLGFDRQRMEREAAMDPLRMKMLEAQVAHQNSQNALTPLQRSQIEAQIAQTRAQTEALGRKDAMDQIFLRAFGAGDQPAAPPQSPIRPQSYAPTPERPAIMTPATVGVAPQEPAGDPMLIRTQAAPGQPQAAPNDPIVDVPGMGKMPRSQAQRLGMFLAYRGKGEAGKMIMDATNPGMLGKEARNEIDKNELKATDALARMKAIRQGVQPEFLTLEEQARQYGISWIDSVDALRKKLPPEEIAKHAAFVKFKRDTVENLNQHILDFTGAAMGRDEVPRLMGAVPTMSDGPTAFMAKLEGVVRQKELAIARYRYLRQNGFNGQPWDGNVETAARNLPLDRMKGIILDDSKRTFQQIRQQFPDADENQIRGATRAAIRQRYGMDI